MAAEDSSAFADLDVLLVNSEKINHLFLQKINTPWITRVLRRLQDSPKHFHKFFETLIDVVVSEEHPEWVSRALRWLEKIFDDPVLTDLTKNCPSSLNRFISFNAEMHGVAMLLNSAVKRMDSQQTCDCSVNSSSIPLVDTGYVFIDDHEVNFGVPKKRPRKSEDIEGGGKNVDVYGRLSLLSDNEDGSVVDEDEEVAVASEDDGVFDVDNGSTYSSSESQLSRSPSQGRVSAYDSENSADSDEEDGEIILDEKESDTSEDDDQDTTVALGTPPSSGEEIDGEAVADLTDVNDDKGELPFEKESLTLRRSLRIRKQL